MSAGSRAVALVVLGLALGGRPARAQDSQFGIAGLGTPGRMESVRARSMGGAFAPFDAESPLTDAALVDLRTPTAYAVQGASYRDVIAPTSSTWLRTTRYPVFTIGGPLSSRLSIAASFATYFDQSYKAETRDSAPLRGTMQPFSNSIVSDGGVTDLRLGAALRLSGRLALGLGVHALVGSTRQSAVRTYDDTVDYRPIVQTGTVGYSGWGVSESAILRISSSISLAAFAREDAALKSHLGDSLVATTDLPATLGGALLWSPWKKTRFAGSVMWSSWSRAGTGAFNTANWSAGLELGTFIPLRLGVRGGELPFGPGSSAPTEWGLSVGTTASFARDHGLVDLGLERLARTGTGLEERVWTLLAGITVRP